jgi:transcription initiation factor TFIIH subunit 4
MKVAAKSIVMAMLYMPGPFYAADLNAWIRSDAKSEKEKSLSVLQQLHIVSTKNDDNGQTYYELVPKFARSLRQALEGSGTHRSFGVPSSQPDPNKVSIAFLDEYARNQWENILFYMVGSTVGLSTSGAQGRDLDNGTKRLLQLGNYITSGGKITREGFSFVLQETNAQVWSLLIVYLRNAPSVSINPLPSLCFEKYNQTNMASTNSSTCKKPTSSHSSSCSAPSNLDRIILLPRSR